MATQTVLYIILAGILAMVLAWFQYKNKMKSMSKLSMLFAFLRGLSIFFILLLLINPKFNQLKLTTEKPKLVVAVDQSNSIRFLKQDTLVKKVLQSIKDNTALNDKFDIHYYGFGSQLTDLRGLNFEAKQTDIETALGTLQTVYKDQVAPTILITDGNQTYGDDYVYTNYKQAVYPVILGDTTTYIDLNIKELNVNKYAYLKNKFPVEAIVVYNGQSPIYTVFKITSGGNTIFTKPLTLSKEKNSEILQLTLPASRVGVTNYKAEIESIKNEQNTINNTRNFAVEVIDEKMNVALVSGFNHPDLGALKKSIESNEQRSVSILKPAEAHARLNDFQLMIMYQPNNQFKLLFDAVLAENRNTLIITGPKTDWYFLNAQSTSYKHEITGQSELFQGVINPNFSAFILNDLNMESFPPLESTFGEMSFNVPREILAYKKLGNLVTEHPLIATLEVNGRREALILGENIWQWRAHSFLNTNSFEAFDNFMGKMVQYLASNKRKTRLDVDYNSFYNNVGNVIIKAQFFNKNYEFDATETLVISLKHKKDQTQTEVPFVLKNNNYQVDLSYLPAGDYEFTVKTQKENISKSGEFTILEYNVEQQFLNADSRKLHLLAEKTNGKAYFIDNYNVVFEDLRADENYKTIQKSTKTTQALIDWKYLLGIIVFLLSFEWFLRKYNGLT